MKKYLAIFAALFLFSCAVGPVQMAKTEQESMKSSYEDAQLRTLYDKNQPLLHDIYSRLRSSQVNIYKEGIGFTTLRDKSEGRHYYLMVNLRPPEIVFDENTSRSGQRFSKVMSGQYFEKYLKYVSKNDLLASGAEGLELGIYWPVRDFSQCRENGGFVEYILVYLSKEDLMKIYDGFKSFEEVASDAEVIASLDLKSPQQVKPVFH